MRSVGPARAGEQRQAPDQDSLDRLPATTERLLRQTERLARELPEAPPAWLAHSLDALVDRLVHDLVPLMAAEELVYFPRLDAELRDALVLDHREVRSLSDRLAILLENLQRHLFRVPERKPLRRVLEDLRVRLSQLLCHQQAARLRLYESLPTDDLRRVASELAEREEQAWTRTLLIAQPQIPSTTAHVLRSRPDLQVAYPVSLAELERSQVQQNERLPKKD